VESALEVEDRDQDFEAPRAPRIGRQDCRGKADALGSFADPVAHPRAAHRDRTDPGRDFALGQMTVAHQPLAAVNRELVGMAAEQCRCRQKASNALFDFIDGQAEGQKAVQTNRLKRRPLTSGNER
jgi:hypothetical protein